MEHRPHMQQLRIEPQALLVPAQRSPEKHSPGMIEQQRRSTTPLTEGRSSGRDSIS
ncbi:hypothetical protein JOF55_004878 [Haloactinomyces albus]|uniref:Uncharacterized protein n=1 Tax=Haloactinomyces albus TaxID=1352928 RepID=A0AAE3ZKQ6_9ACTN|nr:hypothetical protein [Haloactinomyces albus]